MPHDRYLLSLDQGTTSTRVFAFAVDGSLLDSEQVEFAQHYPELGWVEHAPEEIWQSCLACLTAVTERQTAAGRCALSLGITNQRETIVAFERSSGKPVANAIVWQDRRTAAACEALRADGKEQLITDITGLLLDPYFSASKIKWLLDEGGLRARAEAGDVAFGTIESYLIYRLTGGKSHITDITNASRTMLCDLRDGEWNETLLQLFNISESMLPNIVNNIGDFGEIDAGLPGAGVPINAAIGDQQSAAIGQGCIQAGMVKSTYGTGCFVMQNTGTSIPKSNHRLLNTVAYSLDGELNYALEGSIFNAGTVTQFFRDQMGFISEASESEALARSVDDSDGVYMVPAFTGLGAPHWKPDARGMIYGLTRNSNKAHVVRAGLEAVAYQTHDLMAAFVADSGIPPYILRVDGGMATNNWLMQFLADLLQVEIERPRSVETTAWGAALLAGVYCGVWPDLEAGITTWQQDRKFTPSMDDDCREALLKGWKTAIQSLLI